MSKHRTGQESGAACVGLRTPVRAQHQSSRFPLLNLLPESSLLVGQKQSVLRSYLGPRGGQSPSSCRGRDLCAWTATDRTITDCRVKPVVLQKIPMGIKHAVPAEVRRQGRRCCTGHHCRIGAPQSEGGGRSSFPSRRLAQPDHRPEEPCHHLRTD